MKKIAILGATGHIAKSLIYNFKKLDNYNLYLFARSTEKLENFLKIINYDEKIEKIDLKNFNNEKYDIIINCIGIGGPGKLENIGQEIFRITEYFDNLILNYLENKKNCKYINFSSGAVYGSDFSNPVDHLKCFKINVNNICNKDNYGIVKLYSEVKHRAYDRFNIIDLRVFNFFSRFIDQSTKYLITEIISCIKKGVEFETDENNIIRDYIHPLDLFNLVCIFIDTKGTNDAFDTYSLKPITKFEILNYFAKEYGLIYKVKSDVMQFSKAGVKRSYYSLNKKAESFGYAPKFSSIDSIAQETKEILKKV